MIIRAPPVTDFPGNLECPGKEIEKAIPANLVGSGIAQNQVIRRLWLAPGPASSPYYANYTT